MTTTNDDPLVSTEWLAAHLDDPRVKVIDATFKMPGVLPLPIDDFRSAHIPGAAFFDVGTATDTWGERVFDPGAGIGARWRSPVGPVNLDVAYGFRTRSVRPYLTLGIAF